MTPSEKLTKYEDVDYEQHMGEALWHALPQLVAVVEDSEEYHAMFHPDSRVQMADGSWQSCDGCAGLAALDEALS